MKVTKRKNTRGLSPDPADTLRAELLAQGVDLTTPSGRWIYALLAHGEVAGDECRVDKPDREGGK